MTQRWVLVVLCLAGCDEGLGGTCKDDDDCKRGLFCAKTGELERTCTASCAEQADYCELRWGKEAVCVGGYCTSRSTAAGDPCEGRCSPNTMRCRTDPPPPTCVPK